MTDIHDALLRDRIKALRAEANRLDGKAALHDYCDNATIEDWHWQADRLRDEASRLEKEQCDRMMHL
jgi:hypothetical protein